MSSPAPTDAESKAPSPAPALDDSKLAAAPPGTPTEKVQGQRIRVKWSPHSARSTASAKLAPAVTRKTWGPDPAQQAGYLAQTYLLIVILGLTLVQHAAPAERHDHGGILGMSLQIRRI